MSISFTFWFWYLRKERITMMKGKVKRWNVLDVSNNEVWNNTQEIQVGNVENVSLHSNWRGVFPTCYLYPRVRSLFTTYLLLSLLTSFFFFCKFETSLTAEDGGIFLLYELRSAWKETCYSCRSFFAPPSSTSLQNYFDVSTSLFPSLCFKLAPPSSSILRRKSEGE